MDAHHVFQNIPTYRRISNPSVLLNIGSSLKLFDRADTHSSTSTSPLQILIDCQLLVYVRDICLRRERPLFSRIPPLMFLSSFLTSLLLCHIYQLQYTTRLSHCWKLAAAGRWEVGDVSNLLFSSAPAFVLLIRSDGHGRSTSLITAFRQLRWLSIRCVVIGHNFASEAPSSFRPLSQYRLGIQSLCLAICPPQISFSPLLNHLPS